MRFPVRRLCAVLLAVVSSVGCITTNGKGEIVAPEPEARPEPGQRRLSELPIKASWTREERQVPVVVAGLPPEAPLRHTVRDLPPVGNQGGQPSGTAWAVGYTAMTVLMRRHGRKDYVCSPSFLYNQLQKEQGGVEIRETATLLTGMGCAPLRVMPYNADDPTTRPSPVALERARDFRAQGFGRVDFTDLNQLRAHLLQGSVVMATLSITKNFIKLEGPKWPGPKGFFVGRHTVAIVGYDDEAREFVIQNSAGTKWGADGFARIPYAWLVRIASNAYVLW